MHTNPVRSSVSIFILTAIMLPISIHPARAADIPNATTSFDPKKDTLVYIGTYTGAKSKGIYAFKLQPQETEAIQNVTLIPLGLVAEAASPSFLELDPKRRLLFAVNETQQSDGKPTGAVSSYSIDPATAKLTLLSRRSAMGQGPCHLVLDKTGRNILVANYGSGNVAVLPVDAMGRLGEATEVIQHTGKSVNPGRQAGPHAHCVTLDPSNRFAYVCDLGLDKVMIYKLDSDRGKLIPNDPPFATVEPGAGPRHMAFRPDGKFAYVINELNSTITAFSHNPESGALTSVQSVSTLPPHFDGQNSTAEIAVHPSGNFLYGSNRGHNSVVLFNIDIEKGTLTWVEAQGTGGKTPRNFGIDPSGKYMVICNQNSDTALASRIDTGNGRLKPSGIFAEVGSPVCAVFLPPTGDGR